MGRSGLVLCGQKIPNSINLLLFKNLVACHSELGILTGGTNNDNTNRYNKRNYFFTLRDWHNKS